LRLIRISRVGRASAQLALLAPSVCAQGGDAPNNPAVNAHRMRTGSGEIVTKAAGSYS